MKLNRCNHLFAIVACALFLCSIASADWPMSGANRERTSWTADGIGGLLKFEWFVPIEPYIPQKVQIIAANDTLYVSTSEGLYALDPNNGKTKWVYKTDLPLGNSPTIAPSVAYVGCFDDRIHAVDTKTGKGLWTFQGGAGFDTNPLVVDGVVYVGCRDGIFYAVDASSANERWRYKTDGPILFSAAYADGVLFFASQDCHAYGLNAGDGSLVWKSEKLPGTGFRSYWPVVYKDRVIFAGTNNYRKGIEPGKMPSPVGNIWSVDRTILPGNTKWGDQLGMSGMRGPVIGKRLEDGRVDVSLVEKFFKAKPHARTYFVLDRKTGVEKETAPMLWAADDGACNRYPPLVGSDGLLYQNMKIMWNPHWMRGHVSGWWFGTPYIWTPSAHHKANDEPLAWAAAGNIVYWNHCSHRSAGAFDVTIPNPHHMEVVEQQDDRWRGTLPYRNVDLGREWVYFDYESINTLAEVQSRKGAFAYGYHGDRNPPIPYKGRVYWHLHNGVVAFSEKGKWPASITHQLDPKKLKNLVSTPVTVKKYLAGLLTHVTGDERSWPALIKQRNYSLTTNADPEWFPLLAVASSDAQRPAKVEVKKNSAGDGTAIFADGNGQQMRITASQSTPAILVDVRSKLLRATGRFAGLAWARQGQMQISTTSATIDGNDLSEGALILWYPVEYHPRLTALRRNAVVPAGESVSRCAGRELDMWTPSPVLISLQRRPEKVTFDSGLLRMEWPDAGEKVVITPIYGLQRIDPRSIARWSEGIPSDAAIRARTLNRLARAYPSAVEKQWKIDPESADAVLTCKYTFTEIRDDWSTELLKVAPVPPHIGLARWQKSPIRVDGEVRDFDYPLGLGRYAGAAGTDTVKITLSGIANLWRKPAEECEQKVDPNDALYRSLLAEIEKMLEAGHLRPGWTSSGQGDNQWHQFALADYFHNPYDTVYPLLEAMPLLPEDMRQKVRGYVKREFADYPPYEVSHIGWATGAAREDYILPPEAEADMKNWPKNKWRGWGVPPHNVYACALYAQEFGGAADMLDKCKDLLRAPDFQVAMPYQLNLHIAGRIGLLRLANLAKADPEKIRPVEEDLLELLMLRAALSKSPQTLADAGFEYGDFDWTVDRYLATLGQISYKRVGQGRTTMDPRWLPGRYEFTIDFLGLTPELGAFLREYAKDEVAEALDDYNLRAPYWFVPWVTEFAGEGTICPLYDIPSQFQARAMILNQPRNELEKYIDVPAFPRGDLFYVQNVTAALKASK